MHWASISGLEFAFEAADDGAAFITSPGIINTRADLRIAAHSIDGQSGPNTLAYNYLPESGDQVIDSDNVIHLVEAEHRVSLLDLDGNIIGRWGEKGDKPGQFVEALHGVWMDSRGDLYICEVPFTPNRLQKFVRV